MVKKFTEYLNEEVGSGTAVGGGAEGSFTSAAGTSVSGGDSGTAFSTNSNTSGMGAIVSAQPSSIPGDVRGGTKGSGDIGQVIGAYSKGGTNTTPKKKKKKDTKRSKTASTIDDLYITSYKESGNGAKIVQKWDTFKESYDIDKDGELIPRPEDGSIDKGFIKNS